MLRLMLVVLSPLVAFSLLELGLRLFQVGRNTAFFIPDEKPGYFRSNPNFTALFFPAQFELKPLSFRLRRSKDKNSMRIFVLGESAVFGTPEPGFGLVEQLRAQLRARYPGRKIEVYNLGITAINSHVIYRIAREAMDFNPDLLVIYAGNNEVVGPYGPGSVSLNEMPPLALIRASVWLRSLRAGQLLLRILGKFSTTAGGVVEWQGMRTFSKNTVRGSDPRLDAVYGNFATNLRDIVRSAARAGIKTVLSTVVANLKDSAPFVSLHRDDLKGSDLQAWQKAFDAGQLAWSLGDDSGAQTELERAAKLDPEYADTFYLLGRIEEECGRLKDARRDFIAALHWDALRFRPDPRINDVIRAVVRESGDSVVLVDAARELGSDPDSAAPLAGHEVLFEHVHFNWEGNYRMGLLLAKSCATLLPAFSNSGAASWLDPAESATALGYTDYGHLSSLFSIRDLTRVSPFTNQITFGEDQARLGREIDQTSSRLLAHDALRLAAAQVEQALSRDRNNPFLPIRLEEIEFQRGNYPQALRLIDQVANLRPRSPELAVKKATILRLLKRYNEAEELLQASFASDPYFLPTAQALGEIWAETAQFAKGRDFFEHLLASAPGNRYLRLGLADLLLRGGDQSGAERECLRVLQFDPSDEGALARLTQLYAQAGRQDEALKLMLAGYRLQPKNYANNVRLAQIFEAKNDAGKAAEFMQAMTLSGPTNAALRLRLAQRLIKLNRFQEAIVQLLKAKQLAELENNADLRQVIKKAIEHAYEKLGPLPSI
jgi:predicted Zn-dependent protease